MDRMPQLEDLVRASLAERARDVTPDPATWRVVQQRVRRQRALRWGGGLAGVGAAAAAVALAVPALTAQRVVIADGPASQPADGFVTPPPPTALPPTPDVAPPAPPLPLVTTDGRSIYLADAFGHSLETLWEGEPGEDFPNITDLVVVPGREDRIEVVYRLDSGCGDLSWGSWQPDGTRDGGGLGSADGACVNGVAAAPDGTHVAWLEADPSEPAWTLHVVAWDGGPRDEATFELGALDGAQGAAIVGWQWTQRGDATAGGSLLVRTETGVLAVLVERQADGAIAVPDGGAEPLLGPGGREVVTATDHDGGRILLVGPADGAERPQGWSLAFMGDDGGVEEVALEGDVARGVDAADRSSLWVAEGGGVVLLGAGDRMWRVSYTGDWSAVQEAQQAVDADVAADYPRSAGPVAPPSGAQAPAADQPPATAVGEPGPAEPIGDPVTARREAIRAAASRGDIDAVAALADDDTFTYSYGESGDFAGHLRRLEEAGERPLEVLAGLLGLPSTTAQGDPSLTVWPFAYDRRYESLSSAELTALEEVIGADAMEAYSQTGDYLGWRVGIAADGDWVFYVAGD